MKSSINSLAGLVRCAITCGLSCIFILSYTTSNATTLGWDPQTGVDSFTVYQSTDLINWNIVTNVSGTNVQATFPTATQQSFYYITASNLAGESQPSNIVVNRLLESSLSLSGATLQMSGAMQLPQQ